MIGQRTAGSSRLAERRKARARLVLLTLIGLVCPPLAGVRSSAVWAVYVILAVLYSLWGLRLAHSFSRDRRLGYLLSLTDGAMLLPLLVWSSSLAMRVLLVLAWVGGLVYTYAADQARRGAGAETREVSRPTRPEVVRAYRERLDAATPLERALNVRYRVLASTNTRFGLIMLRIVRFEEIGAYYGAEASARLVSAVTRRGLRLLGPDAQSFSLAGGRVAFVFATGAGAGAASSDDSLGWIDPYDVESAAMTVARRVCEHLIDGHRVECVVGWASAPADGMSAEDLVYAAEAGAQSTAAFRRVAGSRIPVPERTRAAAG